MFSAALLAVLPCTASVEVAGRAWDFGAGLSVSGKVATVSTVGAVRKSASLTTKIDVSPYLECGVEWQIRVRGRGVWKPAKPYLGVKAMLTYEDASGKRQYPGPVGKTGDFGWHVVRYRAAFKNGVRGNEATLVLGLQDAEGEVAYDLASLRVSSMEVPREPVDEARVCEYTPRVAALPTLRGVMSPSRQMNEGDFLKLRGWGVRLLRYQMNRFWNLHDANRDLADYDKWLDSKLDHLEAVVLPLAAKYGIKVAVDLHMPPGGRASDGEMNMFYEPEYADHFVGCWRKIARRFRANPALYGYDIINEPNQTYTPANGLGWWRLQKEAAEAIRAVDPLTPIIVESNNWDSPGAFAKMPVLDMKDVIYEVHLYSPMAFTHQGVGRGRPHMPTRWPDAEKGWNRDALRKVLAPVLEFQRRHGARIYVGEFSAVAWAEGAEKWLEDAISVFEEHGWDWTYHAYGEFEGWSVEHSAERPYEFRPDSATPRKAALLGGLSAGRAVDGASFDLTVTNAAVERIDFGPSAAGGYAQFEVVGLDAAASGSVLRVAYACHPDGLSPKGDFWRETSARYLGKDVDLPILPANIDRYELYTLDHVGTYRAKLHQGLVRYARLSLDSRRGTVAVRNFRLVNDKVHSEGERAGSFVCSDARLSRLWEASVRTCELAAIPSYVATHVTPHVTTLPYLSDGAKRDRLVWSGDLWFAERTYFYGFRPDAPYMRGSIDMLAANQTPEGYIQASPWPEQLPPGAGEWGPFGSDEFACWFVPVLQDYYLHTADMDALKRNYPNVVRLMSYLARHQRRDGIFEQRKETCKHAAGLVFGGTSLHHRSYMNILLWKTYVDAAYLADAVGASDGAKWRAAADAIAKSARRSFWKGGFFALSEEDASMGFEANALALATRFATAEEAAAIMPRLVRVNHGKFQQLAARGKFEYGDAKGALKMLEDHNWYKILDPGWQGTRLTSECMNLRRNGWGDEAHPDTCVASLYTNYVLGITPLEPGFRVFAFNPLAVNLIDSASGEVPTPHGVIKAAWWHEGGKLRWKVSPPSGTRCKTLLPE